MVFLVCECANNIFPVLNTMFLKKKTVQKEYRKQISPMWTNKSNSGSLL